MLFCRSCAALEDSFYCCDAHLEVASSTDPWWDDSGSTASLALLQQDMLLLANAGKQGSGVFHSVHGAVLGLSVNR
jgi:hypothetical protein